LHEHELYLSFCDYATHSQTFVFLSNILFFRACFGNNSPSNKTMWDWNPYITYFLVKCCKFKLARELHGFKQPLLSLVSRRVCILSVCNYDAKYLGN